MGSFRLWLEGWENDKVDLGGGLVSIRDACHSILSKYFSGASLSRLMGQLGSNPLVRRDSRIAIPLASWYATGLIRSFRDHDSEWLAYLDFRKEFRSLRGVRDLPEIYASSERNIRTLLDSTPLDFIDDPNRLHDLVSGISVNRDRALLNKIGPVGSLKADGGIYKLYSVSTREDANLHLAAGSPKWCVLSNSFGDYGGPPYMPITFTKPGSRPRYVGIFIPGEVYHVPYQGLRNAANDGIMDSGLIRKLMPLFKPYLPEFRMEDFVRLLKIPGMAELMIDIFGKPSGQLDDEGLVELFISVVSSESYSSYVPVSKKDLLRAGLPRFRGDPLFLARHMKFLMEVLEPGPEFKEFLVVPLLYWLPDKDYNPEWSKKLGLTNRDFLEALSHVTESFLSGHMETWMRVLKPGPEFKDLFIGSLLGSSHRDHRREWMEQLGLSDRDLLDKLPDYAQFLSMVDLRDLVESFDFKDKDWVAVSEIILKRVVYDNRPLHSRLGGNLPFLVPESVRPLIVAKSLQNLLWSAPGNNGFGAYEFNNLVNFSPVGEKELSQILDYIISVDSSSTLFNQAIDLLAFLLDKSYISVDEVPEPKKILQNAIRFGSQKGMRVLFDHGFRGPVNFSDSDAERLLVFCLTQNIGLNGLFGPGMVSDEEILDKGLKKLAPRLAQRDKNRLAELFKLRPRHLRILNI